MTKDAGPEMMIQREGSKSRELHRSSGDVYAWLSSRV